MTFLSPSFARLDGASLRQFAFQPSLPLCFMHVPKTSGVALRAGLWDAIGGAPCAYTFDRSLFGCFDQFETFDRAAGGQILHGREALPANVRLVAGHFSLSTLRAMSASAQVLTILREPCSRLLSHWLFWRQISDDFLGAWGAWAAFVRSARRPLARFLANPALACQTDNLAVRMLLWPHQLIPQNGFIAREHDAPLTAEAMAKLAGLSFVDIVENDAMQDNVQAWLGRPLVYERMNETNTMPEERRRPMDQEVTPEAEDLIEERSRLDLVLWASIAARCVGRQNLDMLRTKTIATNMDRYRRLMQPSPGVHTLVA